MKNLMKTASAQNFHRLAGHGARFIRKFESMQNDIPEVDISRDLQELGENVEQIKEAQPLPKALVDSAINFLKSQGINDGRVIRFEFNYEGKKSKVSYIKNNPSRFEGEYLAIQIGNDFYFCDLNGKTLILEADNNRPEYVKKAQKVVNGVLTTLANYY